MNIGLIIALVAILLVLVLGYNIMLQYKSKVETVKKQETARYVAVIDSTEELLGHANNIPFSKTLLLCLNHRILDALQSMQDLDPKNKQVATRIATMQQQLADIDSNFNDEETTSFKIPANDKQAIAMLKIVKKLRETVRNEHNKGRMDTQAYVNENGRLESMQIRINIENVIKRANDAISRGQSGTALQLLRKGIDALSSKSDSYSQQAKEKLQTMLDDLDQQRQSRDAVEREEIENRERNDDMDALFGDKKKW